MIPSPALCKKFVTEFDEKLRMWSTSAPARIFDDIFNLVYDPRTLRAASCQVAKAKGADTPGVDGVTAGTIEQSIGSEMLAKQLSDEVKNLKYQPSETRETVIDNKGKPRTISTLAFRDRVVQRAVGSVLSPIIEHCLHPGCSAYLKGRGPKYAFEVLKAMLNDPRTQTVISTDFFAFFDAVQINKLLRLIRKHVSDRKMIALLETILTSGKTGEKGSTNIGIVQGAPLSPLLSNVYSQPVLEFVTSDPRVVDVINYGDDTIIGIEGNQDIAEDVLGKFTTFADEQLGLQLAHSKTTITQMGGEIDFLGATTAWNLGGLIVRPASRAIERLKNKLTAVIAGNEQGTTGQDTRDLSAQAPVIESYLAGFTNYFGGFSRRSEIELIGKEVLESVVRRS